MAIYHLSAQVISRSAGRSSVAAAAYRAGERLIDQRTGLAHDYSRRREEIETRIYAPEGAPEWVQDRSRLWNGVEACERRRDSQVCREINVALPRELSRDQQRALVEHYVQEQFVARGMVADVAFHRGNPENPHAHIMLTMRRLGPEEFGSKEREWNRPDALQEWRERWAEHNNRALERSSREERIDHRSLADQGITDRLPQVHVGPHARAMEDRGRETDRGSYNREIETHNGTVIDLEKAREERQALTIEKAVEERFDDRVQHGWPLPTATSLADLERKHGREITEEELKSYGDQIRSEMTQISDTVRDIDREGYDLGLSRERLGAVREAEQALQKHHTPWSTVRRWVSPEARDNLRHAENRLSNAKTEIQWTPIKTESELAQREVAFQERKSGLPALNDRQSRLVGGLNVIESILKGFQNDLRRQRERDERDRERYQREAEYRGKSRGRERERER